MGEEGEIQKAVETDAWIRVGCEAALSLANIQHSYNVLGADRETVTSCKSVEKKKKKK